MALKDRVKKMKGGMIDKLKKVIPSKSFEIKGQRDIPHPASEGWREFIPKYKKKEEEKKKGSSRSEYV